MRKFYTAQDVASCASKGESVIAINREDVVTSVAKEAAAKEGIKFVYKDETSQTNIGNSSLVQQYTPKSTLVNTTYKIETPNYEQVKTLPYNGLITEAEVDKWREEFPILKNVAHLGNCSQSAQSKRVLDGINRYLENWGGIGMDWDSWCQEVDEAKAEFAKLINADPEEIAVASSVSDLVSSIANSLDYTGKRKKVVITDAEFPTVAYIWLANQRYGAKVDFVSVNENHQIDISEYERYIDENTLLTSITQVYYLNGFKQDISRIAEIAHSKGSLILVDAYQSLGTDPVDVKAMNIDILVSGCLKYLFGIPGIAFMYVNKKLVQDLKPSVTGWFSQTNPFLFQTRYLDWANKASRFDTGTPPVLNAYACKAGLEIINEVGDRRIKDRIDMLSAHALKGVIARGLTTWSPFDVSMKGGTTAIQCGHKVDSHTMEGLLRKRNIIGSGRGDVIRIAPHFYTKPDEIDYALDSIKDILEGR
ncbi:aminotransferase class V-fold PLP-dependent enzyme [Maledivibacter halophilus]|uniref:Selenocysteine lyase/Cysteine desulfurase n=1 Tax=Maledivibacter halophilus TaxID=36842 RepID=A0A1T5IAI0_9FIRM|nr:aminotransferase class V-fold PLP-dependent enzyme [Maledivibacter halophilus]SKC35962.1 Selenocysteine lyase/Cysteine desulfurase [Maledivibacter halophilus]